ncbi:ankyrin repeat domain-containing protein [Kaarinaea lacus]
MPCSHIQGCEMYVRFAADPSIEVWKKHFCNGDFNKCARYSLSLQGKSVPLHLLPNGKMIEMEADTVDVGLNTLFNAIKKDRLQMVQAIVRVKNLNEDMTNSAGVNPTMYAASLGRKEMVELFISKGCDPHNTCNNGKTALVYAEENGHNEIAEILKAAMSRIDTRAPKKTSKEKATTKESSSSLFERLFGFLRSSKKAA